MRPNRTQPGIALLTTALLAVLVAACSTARVREQPDFAEFLIVVNATAEQVRLTCQGDCAWTELSFQLAVGMPAQGVDERGMRTAGSSSTASQLFFTIARGEDEIQLQGVNGTAWTSLTFGCVAEGCTQGINQYGMTSTRSL